jgi:hypothetical protein
MLIAAWTLVGLEVMLVALLLMGGSRVPRRTRDEASAKASRARYYGKPIGQAHQEWRAAP